MHDEFHRALLDVHKVLREEMNNFHFVQFVLTFFQLKIEFEFNFDLENISFYRRLVRHHLEKEFYVDK
jgi:hypothetical protein